MSLFALSVAVSTLLCALVAGFLFAFAAVAMPGLQTLDDRDFLRAFAVMDRVIQRRQPLFMSVWAGSVVALLVAGLTGFWDLQGSTRWYAVLAVATYLLGVQLPTATVNIPLNNRLQSLDLDRASDAEIRDLRRRFERRWTRWNAIRTGFATLTLALLIVVLLRL